MAQPSSGPAEQLSGAVHPLAGTPADFDPLLDLIGEARLVLLGEATHGTHEFYQQRAEITRRLIREKGFTAVAVEADWPDALRVHRYVVGRGADQNPNQALGSFHRFPRWMWRNEDVHDLVGWLREHNQGLPPGTPGVGFFGLDLYSLHASADEVIGYLERVDPEAAARARQRYGCFDHFGEDTQAYGYAAEFGMTEPCEQEAIRQLQELQRQAPELIAASGDGDSAEEEQFFAEQNARLVQDAEEYYRTMFRGRVSSWNVRDRHMADTVDALLAFLTSQGREAKVVVWEHNSHLGDARATYMSEIGEWNVGQLVRERHGDDSRLIGWSTYTGTVTAASDWGGPAETKRVRPGLHGSYEALFHQVSVELGVPNFYLPLRGAGPAAELLRTPRLERAIGVLYLPETERMSHYFHARLADQFDAVLHFDTTRAVVPLDGWPGGHERDAPDTFPSGV